MLTVPYSAVLEFSHIRKSSYTWHFFYAFHILRPRTGQTHLAIVPCPPPLPQQILPRRRGMTCTVFGGGGDQLLFASYSHKDRVKVKVALHFVCRNILLCKNIRTHIWVFCQKIHLVPDYHGRGIIQYHAGRYSPGTAPSWRTSEVTHRARSLPLISHFRELVSVEK
jgi:hypothetical protein